MTHEHHHHGHDHGHDDDALGDLLDLDAEVLSDYLADLVGWTHGLTGDLTGERVLDIGSGTGAGTFALAGRYPDAEVVAVDMSAEMGARLQAGADRRGVGARVRTVQADLDGAWPALGPAGLAWASNSMHHMADPDRAIGEVFAALRPGGLFTLIEMDSHPRFLTEDGGLEDRIHAALAEQRAHDMPTLGAGDWGDRLHKAGFVVAGQRTFTIDVRPPLPEATGRYARASLTRIRSGLADRLDAADLAALDELIGTGPGRVENRPDLGVRAQRSAWAGRRP